MNKPLDLDTTTLLKTAPLPKTGGAYALVLLTAEHIDQILTLQDKAFGTLSPQEQTFLLRKTRDFFEKHFAEGNTVLGVVHNGTLIAQSIVINPTTRNPKTGMVDMKLEGKADKISILQGIVVDPDYRGNHLMTVMIDVWLTLAKKQARTQAISEVAVGNMYSWYNFLKEGLQIHSIGTDPTDGTQVYNMHAAVAPLVKKRLKSTFNRKSAKTAVQCPHADLDAQKKLLSEGYKGTKFNPANDTLEFRPTKKVHRHKGNNRLP